MLDSVGSAVSGVQLLVFWGLFGLFMVVKVMAVTDAVRHKPQSYVSAGKMTKPIWLSIVGVALAVNIVLFNPLNFLNVIGLVAAGVYLADVRPALRQVSGHGGSSSSSGPYGPW